jgi:hypothetical protein
MPDTSWHLPHYLLKMVKRSEVFVHVFPELEMDEIAFHPLLHFRRLTSHRK